MQVRTLIAGIAAFLVIAACAPVTAPASQQPTLSLEGADSGDGSGTGSALCDGVLTSPDQEGPFYTAGSPKRASLIEKGMPGAPIVITGRVYDQDCNPIANSKVDFWQADASGIYDNAGYTLRGHVVTEDDGGYAMETIAPGPYTGRPPHIHVKVFAADGRELLTTQIYFPGSEQSRDVRAAPDLLATYGEPDQEGRAQVRFDFVVQY
jgi:protocatechuate 3,4-dioxygenase beta subunit